MYISSYWPPNPIFTVQSEESHVMDHLSKFHLNQTVNREMQFYENCANQKNWWRLVPRIRQLAPGGTKIPLGNYCYVKSTKNNVFRESTHHAPLVWRLAANMVPPGGSCTCEPCLLHNNSDFIQFTTQKVVLTCLGSWSIPKTFNK